MDKKFEKKPFYKKWWFITIAAILFVGVIATIFEPESWKEERLQEEQAKADAKELKEAMKKVGTVTPEEFNKLKEGMSYEEVIKNVGGKAKNEDENQFNEELVTLDFDGENGVEEKSTVALLFNNGKLDTIMETGLIEKKKELTPEQKEEIEKNIADTRSKASKKVMIEEIVESDLSDTEIKSIKINNYQLEDDKYIVLANLKWNTQNGKKTTKQMLEMFSENLTAKLYDDTSIVEVVVIWEVPYHLENANVAKYTYTRAPSGGMDKTDNWIDSILN